MTRARAGALGVAVLTAACGVLSPEEQVLTRFFQASRLHDTTAVASLSDVAFNPRTEGVVREFDVVDVQRRGASAVVIVEARIAAPDGPEFQRTLRVTLQRREGRLIVVGVS